ncbi:MAG TPA: hypothetical protein VFB07_07350 [Vicinamibacterales bacterium]|nr:hypothetical protein [Vicinamibacterales bacterium]
MIAALLASMLAVEPVRYTVTNAAPTDHVASVDATFPLDGHPPLELMMPIWSPGFYKVEHYATRIVSPTADRDRRRARRRPSGSEPLADRHDGRGSDAQR